MSASLVGSEMCIRDRTPQPRRFLVKWFQPHMGTPSLDIAAMLQTEAAVSYTHLTLPTICSV
eukprot:2211888-Alexandrium_andersonii.AAC.1